MALTTTIGSKTALPLVSHSEYLIGMWRSQIGTGAIALTFAVAACNSNDPAIPSNSEEDEVEADTHHTEDASHSNARPRQVNDPFPDATEVRLFVQTGYSDDYEPILSSPRGVILSDEQRQSFEDTLSIAAAPAEAYSCFVPHHFFRYFDADGDQVGEVSVCFCCVGVDASGSDALLHNQSEIIDADFDELEHLVTSLGEPTDVLCD